MDGETITMIGFISSIATLISFVIGFIWNYQSNKKAKRDSEDMYRKFAENLISIRKMEIERVNAEIEKLTREAETLQILRDMKLSHTGDDEKILVSTEYNSCINNLSFSIMQLKQLVAQWGLDTTTDLNEYLKKLAK